MTRNELYRRARNMVQSRRQRALTLAREQRLDAEQRVPQMTELEGERTRLGARAAQLAALGADKAEVDKQLAAMQELETRLAAMLVESGIAPQQLEPQFTCEKCKDTGIVDGVTCACVHALVRELRRAAVNESSPLLLCSFDTFQLDKYPETPIPELGVTARAQMTDIYEYCKAYAAHFSPHCTSLYLCGYAGLGKTHLALSIAREVLEQGYDVVYVSAQEAFDKIEKERFSDGGGTMLRTLQGAELLVLDDLGTEYLSPYVGSCLYSLINARGNRRLPTIYTSNIVNDADLRRRYTEKIVSRLLGGCEVLSFFGEDVRLQGK